MNVFSYLLQEELVKCFDKLQARVESLEAENSELKSDVKDLKLQLLSKQDRDAEVKEKCDELGFGNV